MQDYRPGEIVLLSFPFTDATEVKRRPALVLLDTGDEDIVVGRVTSQVAQGPFDVELVEWLKAAANTGWENVLTVLFLAICYTTGILFDRFADWIFPGASERLKERIIPNPPEPYVVMRFKAAKGDEYLNRLFEYIRSRMRVARASAINLPLIAVFGLILVATRATGISQSAKLGLFITIPVFGVTFTMLAVFSWHRLMSTHLRLVKSSYEGAKLKETPSTGTSHTDE